MDPTSKQKIVRLSVNLNEETAAALRLLAAQRGDSITETIRRAIAVLHYIDGEVARGNKVLIDEGDQYRQIVLL